MEAPTALPAEKGSLAHKLQRWLPLLAARMEGKSTAGFYEAALELIVCLTELEAEAG